MSNKISGNRNIFCEERQPHKGNLIIRRTASPVAPIALSLADYENGRVHYVIPILDPPADEISEFVREQFDKSAGLVYDNCEAHFRSKRLSFEGIVYGAAEITDVSCQLPGKRMYGMDSSGVLAKENMFPDSIEPRTSITEQLYMKRRR